MNYSLNAAVTGDKKNDLVIVGEWMAPRVFTFEKDHFVEIKTNLSDLFGWWQTVAAADVDGDGDNDLIIGNIGENFYLKPGKDDPVKLWVSDFDNNGVTDKIFSREVAGKDVTVFLKKDLTDQIPSLKKNNLHYADFATKSIQQLFSPEQLGKAVVKTFNYPTSIVAINNGNGNFQVKPLPPQIQFSSVNAILCTDINHDGKTDLVTGGNKFVFQPQFSRLDASLGDMLTNDGKGNFVCVENAKTGMQLRGQVKDIKEIKGKNENYILVLQNNEYPVLFKINDTK